METWNITRKVLERNKHSNYGEHIHLFTGIVRCPTCGKILSSTNSFKYSGTSKEKVYYHLTCKNLNCKSKGIHYNSDKIEQKLVRVLNELTNEDIKNLIYTIRGKQVMLDSDVARLFEYATKELNRNVKNNIERFPEYYCFQLTDEEYKSLRCKIFTLNENGRGQHRKYLPYVFTEYGITMLAGLLKC